MLDKSSAFCYFLAFLNYHSVKAYLMINNRRSQKCGLMYLDMQVVVDLEKRIM